MDSVDQSDAEWLINDQRHLRDRIVQNDTPSCNTSFSSVTSNTADSTAHHSADDVRNSVLRHLILSGICPWTLAPFHVSIPLCINHQLLRLVSKHCWLCWHWHSNKSGPFHLKFSFTGTDNISQLFDWVIVQHKDSFWNCLKTLFTQITLSFTWQISQPKRQIDNRASPVFWASAHGFLLCVYGSL